MIDRVFKANDVRGTYPQPLNEETAWRIGHATALYLQRSRAQLPPEMKVKREDTLVVGRDMRPSSPEMNRSLIEGILAAGMNVVSLGMVDTSMIYFAVNELETVGGVMTTASHNPINYNGFKISGPKAKPIGSATGLDDIRRIAGTLRVGQTGVRGRLTELDLWEDYRNHVLKFLQLRHPMRVLVDASNGMAGHMVPKIFNNVNNLEIVPMLFETDGTFVHDPNPLVDSNMDMLKQAMEQEDPPCDIGVCFDGDADRCFFVDDTRRSVGCDLLTALIARDFLQMREHQGSAIVYDLRASKVVPEEIKAAGGVPKRERVGHAFLKRAMAESKAVFGGELSGHFYFRDNYNCDSGAIAFARVLSIISASRKPLSELVAPLRRYHQSGEINFKVEDKEARIRKLAEEYKRAKVDYVDGITIDLGDWWFNVRKSNTEPYLRLNIEASSPDLLDEKLGELEGLLGRRVEKH